MKGQALIIQFLLFFLIGLSIFTALGNFFRSEQDAFLDVVLNSSIKLVNSYFSSHSLLIFTNCRECDSVVVEIRMKNTTAGHFLGIVFDRGIEIEGIGSGKTYRSSAHNLNFSVNFTGNSLSFLPISLTYNKSKNYLEVK